MERPRKLKQKPLKEFWEDEFDSKFSWICDNPEQIMSRDKNQYGEYDSYDLEDIKDFIRLLLNNK